MERIASRSRQFGKLIALEGVDASGKTTQIERFIEWLQFSGVSVELFSFPRTNAPGFGETIARFLRGEFGPVEAVSPFLIAAVFAADRLSAKPEICAALNEFDVVVVDRYVYSNIAFQCAKISDPRQKQQLKLWVMETEFRLNGLPRPDAAVYLRVSDEFVREINSKRAFEDRAYLKGSKDIHEHSFDLQRQVAVEYEDMLKNDPVMRVVDCVDERGQMKSPSEISGQLISLVAQTLELTGVPVR